MKEKTIENIRRSWKIQTFQYDYISHVKERFLFFHFIGFIFSFILIFVHPFCGLLAIPCLVSWNYLMFFDKRRRAYKDLYTPMRYECIGTLFTTFFSVLLYAFFVLVGDVRNVVWAIGCQC